MGPGLGLQVWACRFGLVNLSLHTSSTCRFGFAANQAALQANRVQGHGKWINASFCHVKGASTCTLTPHHTLTPKLHSHS